MAEKDAVTKINITKHAQSINLVIIRINIGNKRLVGTTSSSHMPPVASARNQCHRKIPRIQLAGFPSGHRILAPYENVYHQRCFKNIGPSNCPFIKTTGSPHIPNCNSFKRELKTFPFNMSMMRSFWKGFISTQLIVKPVGSP